MVMTQHELIIEFCYEYGSILPAKIGGHLYQGEMFGSEVSKRCRELRKKGILISYQEGKFERFELAEHLKPKMLPQRSEQLTMFA